MTRRQTIIGLVAAVFLGALVGAGFLVYRHLHSGPTPPNAIAPELLSPTEGEVLVNGSATNENWTWEFRWSEVPGAEQYHLQVVGQADKEPRVDEFIREPRHNKVWSGGFHGFGEGALNGWRWQVQAKVNGQWSEWSKSRTFSLSKPPFKPSQVSQEEYEKRFMIEFAVLHLITREKRGRDKASELARSEEQSKLSSAINSFVDTLPDGRSESKLGLGMGNWISRNNDDPLLYAKVGLVKDVEAYGLRQTLGRVRAYDPAKRALLIEVGQPPMPRGQWKNAAELERWLTAHGVRGGLVWAVEGMGKDQPMEQMAFLQFRGELARDLFEAWKPIKATTKEKLKALVDGPEEQRAVSQAFFGDDRGGPTRDVSLVVSPVKDFAAFIRKIDFAEVLFSDAEFKVIILGPLKKKKK